MRHIVCKFCGYDLSTSPGCTDADFVCPECGAAGSGRLDAQVKYAPSAARWVVGSLATGLLLMIGSLIVSTDESMFRFPTGAASFGAQALAWLVCSAGIWYAYSKPRTIVESAVHATVSLVAGLLIALMLLQITFAAWFLGMYLVSEGP